MKTLTVALLLTLLPLSAFAITYHCKANDGTVAEFEFQNGAPIQATMTFLGISHDTEMMMQLMEDYQEVAGQSLYVEVSVVDYDTNGILFNAKYVPGSTTQMKGTLDIFNQGPMKSVPLTCTSSN